MGRFVLSHAQPVSQPLPAPLALHWHWVTVVPESLSLGRKIRQYQLLYISSAPPSIFSFNKTAETPIIKRGPRS